MKRKTLPAALAMLFALLFAACALADGAVLSGRAYVCNPDPTDRLNLRAAPRKDAITLGKYYNGTPVEILGEAEGNYVRVRISPLEGYMDTTYLSAENTNSALPQLTVTADVSSIMDDVSYEAKTIAVYGHGTQMVVLGVRDDGWVHVTVEGYNGFVREEDLSAQLSFHKGDHAGEDSAVYAVVNNPDPADRLNLRAQPSKKATLLGKYFNGTVVEILDTTSDGWAHVRIAGTAEGYMRMEYLNMHGTGVTSAIANATVQNRGGSGLYLREYPSSAAKSLGLYPNGTQVTRFGVWYNGYVHVTIDGKTGYMQADKLSGVGLTFEPLGAQG